MSDFYVVYQNYEVYSISSVTPPENGMPCKAGERPGRPVKQEQEEISPNHIQRLGGVTGDIL